MSLIISDPFQFEEVVAELFEKMGYNSIVTKKTGDYGIDVIAKKDVEVIAIQVKLFNIGNNVGNNYVQKLLGSMQMSDVQATKSILITSSDFTVSAIEQGKNLPIEFWNGSTIKQYMEKYFNDEVIFKFQKDNDAIPFYEEIFPEFPFLKRSQQEAILDEIKKGPSWKINTIKMLRDISHDRISLQEAKQAVEDKMISLGYTTKEEIKKDEKSGCIIGIIAIIIVCFLLYYCSR